MDIKTDPLVRIDVEFVEGDMSGRDQNLLHEGVHPLEDGEIEEFGALLVEVRHQLPALRHLSRCNFRDRKRS